MTLKTDSLRVYYNVKQAWWEELPKSLKPRKTNYDYSANFRTWLAAQGVTIDNSPSEALGLLHDTLGIAAGYDFLVIEDPELATVFLLKYS